MTNLKLKNYTRTKIIATLGPAVNDFSAVSKLIQAGADAFRLNFSHGTYDERIKQIEWVRKAAKQYDKQVAIIADLQGPKLRLGDFEDIINIAKGRVLGFKYEANYVEDGFIPLMHDISAHIHRGQRLLVNDGRLRFKINAVKNGVVYAAAENSGILIRRKGVSVPDTDFRGDIITEKDKKDVAFCSDKDIDYIALSFVQNSSDIKKLRQLMHGLNMKAKIIAKIETKAATENLEPIIEEADAVMVARGDLAVETLPEHVPIVQRKIIELAKRHAKPSIVATQMLGSMVTEIEPTRAEVSDVSTAALLGTDTVMLSDETAAGEHPIEAVLMAKRVISYAEENYPSQNSSPVAMFHTKQAAICSAAIFLSQELSATAIVAETKSGATALLISSQSPSLPIVAVTSDTRVANQLSIVRSVQSFVRPDDKQAAKKLTDWLASKKIFHSGDVIITCSGQYPGVVGATDTIKVRVI